MIRARLVSIFFMLTVIAAPAAAENRAEREAAARRYLDVVGPGSIVEESALPAFRGIPPVEAHEIAKAYLAELDMERIEQLLVDALVLRFTAAELDALATFQATPEGRSAMRKLGRHRRDVASVLHADIEGAIAAVRADMQPLASPAP